MNRKDRILPIIKSLLAEFAGTFTLVILSCGTATAGGSLGEISLAFTFAVASSVAFSAHASGGHLNPAVTMGFLATGRLHPARAAAYIVVQCLGGIAAAGTLYGISPVAFVKRGLGATTLHTDIDPFQGTVIETIITFVLLVVVFSVCDTHRMDIGGSGPLTIGISVGACHLFAVESGEHTRTQPLPKI
ncbi:hypothetical protein LAZ67_X000006 [Cordylochernes scorpioides]|uniref:Aquaporin n=1 Tax=Cordylochernes scorpioides TaxID=51811 RepID=A0ABY6LRH1_9ARAC|nr:hypothetical protein LAZ67_X000006 [Cordylochernes scorpioides]